MPLLVLAVVSVLLAAAALSGPPARDVTFGVIDVEAGSVLAAYELASGEPITLQHRHSVTRRMVRERFTLDADGSIRLIDLWFDTHGPNLPAHADMLPEGATLHIEDGGYRVVHTSTTMELLPLLVGGDDVDHELVFADGTTVRLLAVARAGAALHLRSLEGGVSTTGGSEVVTREGVVTR